MQVVEIMLLLWPLKAMQDAGRFPLGGITVVSNFDGIGGAAVALWRLQIRVARYFTSEIDEKRTAITR